MKSHVTGSFGIPGWILIAWFIVFGLCVTIATPTVNALHHDHGNPRLHNKQIHYAASGHSSVDEDFCTQVENGSGISESTLRSRVDDALLYQSAHWDGAGNWRIDMYHTASNCFDPIYGDRSAIEFQFRTHEVPTGGKWCGDGYSCVSHYNAVDSGFGHNDYLNEVAFLEQDHVTGTQYTWRQIVSHETGHMVGFRDPDYYGHCHSSLSIMHIPWYGCPDPGTGPTSADLSTLVHIMDGH